MRYAVLYGSRGVKEFSRKSDAVRWGKEKAWKTKKSVDIDKVADTGGAYGYGYQSTIKTIRPQKPRRMVKRTSARVNNNFGIRLPRFRI